MPHVLHSTQRTPDKSFSQPPCRRSERKKERNKKTLKHRETLARIHPTARRKPIDIKSPSHGRTDRQTSGTLSNFEKIFRSLSYIVSAYPPVIPRYEGYHRKTTHVE